MAEMGMLDMAIVGGVIIFGLVIMYRALKEPMDMLFGYLKQSLIWIKDQIGGGATVQVIRYE